MAKSVNHAILLGNTGKDPEIRSIPSGGKVATVTLATSDRYKDNSGEWKEKTEWHNLVAYGRIAEVIEQYVKKGSKLYIEGKIETRSWEDKHSGEKKYQTQIKIDELILAGERTSAPRAAETNDWDDFK